MSSPDLQASGPTLPDFHSAAAVRHRRRRHIRDVSARYLMTLGGISVLLAIVLIAFYLLYVVAPLFYPARINQLGGYAVPGGGQTMFMALEEQREIGLRVADRGRVVFFSTKDGAVIREVEPARGLDARVTAFGSGDPSQRALALGLSDGTALLFRHQYEVSWPNDVRVITPELEFPLGEAPIVIDPRGTALRDLAVQYDDDAATVAALTADGRVLLINMETSRSLLGGPGVVEETLGVVPVEGGVSDLLLDVDRQELYVIHEQGLIDYFDITDKERPRLVQRVNAVPSGVTITTARFLAGGISLLVGDSRGQITQWFPVRDDENNYTLQNVRRFRLQRAPIMAIAPEHSRKGFAAVDAAGMLGLYHATADRSVKQQRLPAPGARVAMAPRANGALVETADGRLLNLEVHNEHPEVSWQSLWGKVWYEGRQRAEYIWQSSAANSDFEPKFSLTPLVFGTLKASLYAMLFSLPLAVFGAMYTAYFMSARMRNIVKPTIELMAALPTVILGFLAGLWLAPIVERNLPGVFACLLLIPLSVVAASWAWRFVPERLRLAAPEGWEAALLVPVICLAGVVAFGLSRPLEVLFFDGNMPLWITSELGLDFSQRNSLVVGVAMGFAVIPVIFSISEDAIYSVPKHLTTGSLALGATPWQTMVRIVLLTASPGIFSAVMIGLGRAVGETMIVVMATGNTAVMDMNIFEGFRALSANIAVEMPESEVGGTHYRILFLAGLVLFMATFFFNTIAELVRQRLRVKYSNL